MSNFPVIVLDFETNGLSTRYDGRAIEVGAVRIENSRITDRFQSLMNPGCRISSFIEDYTGITNEMVAGAPQSRRLRPRPDTPGRGLPEHGHGGTVARQRANDLWNRFITDDHLGI